MRLTARILLLSCALLALLLVVPSGTAQAQTPLTLEAVPVLGASSPSVDGWGELYLRLENTTDQPLNGFLELHAEPISRGGFHSGSLGPDRALSRAPFALAGKGRVSLLLPIGTASAEPRARSDSRLRRPASKALSTVRSNLVSDRGFSTKSKAPKRVASTAVSTVPWPDIITTGQS